MEDRSRRGLGTQQTLKRECVEWMERALLQERLRSPWDRRLGCGE